MLVLEHTPAFTVFSAPGATAKVIFPEPVQMAMASLKRPQQTSPCVSEESNFEESYRSALTKFDALSSYFAIGQTVPAVANMIVAEMLADKDFHMANKEEVLLPLVKAKVGRAHGVWKKLNPGVTKTKFKQVKDNPLPWPSIDAYPEWVAESVLNYTDCDWDGCMEVYGPDERARRKRSLEHRLLEQPLNAASIKFDGTCFGKMNTGELVGRKHLLCSGTEEYQHTSVAAASTCDAERLRQNLSEMIGMEVASLCVWGELMCNPGFYDYAKRGLDCSWLCFGVVAKVAPTHLDSDDPTEAVGCEVDFVAGLSKRIRQLGLAHSVAKEGKFRLMMCPALKTLLEDVGCRVEGDFVGGATHAEMISQAAEHLRAGVDEGLVVCFTRNDGQSSLRKWKNAAEGGSISKKHAALLRKCRERIRALGPEDSLNPGIGELVDTLIGVAEANTKPEKKGRSNMRQLPGKEGPRTPPRAHGGPKCSAST